MPRLKLTQPHSEYPTRGEALLAALQGVEPMPMQQAIAYAGLEASTITGYLKRCTYDPGDGSYEHFRASENGKACRDLFERLSGLRILVELRRNHTRPLSEDWWLLTREELGYASVWPYKRWDLAGSWFGREAALLEAWQDSCPLAIAYLEGPADRIEATDSHLLDSLRPVL